jgi:hypothetical protein
MGNFELDKVKKPMKTKQQKLGLRINEMLRARNAGKVGYAEADRLLEELVKEWPSDNQVDLGDGNIAILVDNFARGNKVWKPCGISRYDIKVSKKLPVHRR